MRKEPVGLFAIVAAGVGLAAAQVSPDLLAAVPPELREEALVLVVAAIGAIARQWVVPHGSHVNSVAAARKAVQDMRRDRTRV